MTFDDNLIYHLSTFTINRRMLQKAKKLTFLSRREKFTNQGEFEVGDILEA